LSSKFLTESTGEKIVKIGQYLAKIWTKYDSLVFFGPPCILLLGLLLPQTTRLTKSTIGLLYSTQSTAAATYFIYVTKLVVSGTVIFFM